MNIKKLLIYLLLLLIIGFSQIYSLNIIKREESILWNDTVRVVIIWNDGTGDEEMVWSVSTGEIGSYEKDFLKSV